VQNYCNYLILFNKLQPSSRDAILTLNIVILLCTGTGKAVVVTM